MKYVDIHTHSHYVKKDVIIVRNVFPAQIGQPADSNFVSVGLHPWHVKRLTMESDIQQVIAYAEDKNVVAIGEIGLDKTTDCPWEDQVEAFERQLSVAASVEKPVILHCVRAYSEILAYRKRSDLKAPWIFHWFNENIRIAETLIRRNCYLSFGHMLFKENSKAYSAFASVPLENLFFETDDAGYSIYEIYEQAAHIRKMPVEKLKELIMLNFTNCFIR